MQASQATSNPDSGSASVPAASWVIGEAAQRKSADSCLPLLEADAVAGNGLRRAQKHLRAGGSRCIWPRGLRDRYGVSGPTLWRWERAGKLPKRDVFVGGRPVGWRPETIERAERGE